MKILILGHGEHGKDTVAELINAEFGLTFLSSSLAAMDVIWPALSAALGYEDDEKVLAYYRRRSHRTLWKELISLYNAADKSALCRLILSKCDMYVGMRCPLEYEASKHLFDKIIYIDACERIPKLDPTMGIAFDPFSMDCIFNNGSKEDLRGVIKCLPL